MDARQPSRSRRLLRYSASRRRVLAGMGGAATSITLLGLAGCSGGGKSGTSSTSAVTGATAAPTPSQPRPGGILKSSSAQDVPSFDPLAAKAAITNSIGAYVYSRLLKFKVGTGARPDGTLEPDVITLWEQPDPLTLVMHLRQGMKLDPRPPTNGRTLTTEDLTLSWGKFASTAVYRGDIVNAANKTAPVLSFTATDPATIELKLAFPDAQLLPSMNFWGGLWIVPKEGHAGGFDPNTETHGSGPWMLEKYTPSVGFSFKKNPNYYGAPQHPLMDGIELPIITDTAQLEAQFKAKNVWFGAGGRGGGIPSTDILSLHNDLKQSRIALIPPLSEGNTISFSWRESYPFRDVRVRRAMSMLIDRDTFIETFNDLKAFQAAGVQMHGYWNTPLSAAWGPYWLDPKDPKFGPSAQYFKQNVAEAKKLLAAAGFADGFETPLTFVAGAAYGRDWGQRAEALMSMLAKGGIRCKANAVDYTSVWIPSYLRKHGDFDGIAMYPNGSRGDPGQWLHVFFSSTGANNQAAKNFPDLDALITAQRRELDRAKRIAAFHDIQRYFAENMPTVPQGGGTEIPVLRWNGLNGPGEYVLWPGGVEGGETTPLYWIDDALRG